MKKYFRYFIQIFRMSAMQPLMYPNDFLWSFATMPVRIGVQIISIYFILQVTLQGSVAQMDVAHLVFVASWSSIIWGIIGITPLGNGLIGYQIVSGGLDKFLLKPLSLVYMCIFQKFYVQKIVEIGIHLCICGYLLFHAYVQFSYIESLQLLFVVSSSIFFVLSIFSLGEALNFYLPNTTFVQHFFEHASSAARYPSDIYPSSFRIILTFLIPAFLITNPIFEIFAHRYSPSLFLLTLTLLGLWSIASFFLWKKGIQSYESAN